MKLRLFAAALVLVAAPVLADDAGDARRAMLDRAEALVAAKHPQGALDTVAPIVAELDAARAAAKGLASCGMTDAQATAYAALAASRGAEAVALSPDLCHALFLKGFALFDLGRIDEAQAAYREVVALAPMHSHFEFELAQTYRVRQDWPTMYETCASAEAHAALADEDHVASEHGLALRCMGYARVQQGRLDEAEALYRRCLEIDPDDAKAQAKLQEIAELRRRDLNSAAAPAPRMPPPRSPPPH